MLNINYVNRTISTSSSSLLSALCHALCAPFSHPLGDMATHIQGKGGRAVVQVFQHGFDIVPTFQRPNDIGVPKEEIKDIFGQGHGVRDPLQTIVQITVVFDIHSLVSGMGNVTQVVRVAFGFLPLCQPPAQ